MSTVESFLEIQRRLGRSDREIESLYERYQVNRSQAMCVIDEYFGGIPCRVDAMVRQALDTFAIYADRFAA